MWARFLSADVGDSTIQHDSGFLEHPTLSPTGMPEDDADVLQINLLVALAVIALASNTAWTVTGFGAGIVFQIGWQLAHVFGIGNGSVKMGVLCSALMQTFMALIQTIYLRKHANSTIVWYLAPSSCIFVVIGLEIMFCIHSNLLKQSLGVIFLGLALQRAYSLWNSGGKERDICIVTADSPRSTKLAIFCAGAGSGLMSGIFGLPSPALMVLCMKYNIEYNTWRACNANTRGFLVFTLIGYSAIRGELKGGEWQLYLTVIIAGLGGVLLGNVLAKSVDQRIFPYVITTMLFFGSVLMLTSDTTPIIELVSALSVVSLCLLAIVAAVLYKLTLVIQHRYAKGGFGADAQDVTKDSSTPKCSTPSGSPGPSPPGSPASFALAHADKELGSTPSWLLPSVVRGKNDQVI
jgi:uncharacterized membrane protein YfcA